MRSVEYAGDNVLVAFLQAQKSSARTRKQGAEFEVLEGVDWEPVFDVLFIWYKNPKSHEI